MLVEADDFPSGRTPARPLASDLPVPLQPRLKKLLHAVVLQDLFGCAQDLVLTLEVSPIELGPQLGQFVLGRLDPLQFRAGAGPSGRAPASLDAGAVVVNALRPEIKGLDGRNDQTVEQRGVIGFMELSQSAGKPVITEASGGPVLVAQGAQVNGLLFTPDGRTLNSSSLDRSARIWNVSAGRELTMLHGLVGFAIALTPDGRRLATGGELPGSAVKLWEPISGREVLSLSGRGEFFAQIAFSPDGKLLAAISLSGTANLWRAPSRQALRAQVRRA